jgi:tripartite ATP-independent transporter DctP family solute receptor
VRSARHLVLQAVILWAAALAALPAMAREFRAADTQSEDYPTVQALNYMGKLIAQRTNGRHQIKVFHSRQLGEEKETIEQTRVGAIDLNRTNVAPIAEFVPLANVLAMPFLFRSIDHLHTVLDSQVGQDILDSFAPHGFVGLTYYDSGARSIYDSVRPIKSVADMKNLKIRVQQSELMVKMITALGAQPIAMPYGQVLTGLATKLVDGAENNWPSFVTTGHFKYAGYYTLTEHTMSPEVLVMSRKAWESLSPEDQKIFKQAALESNIYMREQWRALEDKSRREAEAAGIMIIKDFDRKSFEDAMADIYKDAANDPITAQYLDRIKKMQ